MSLLRCFSAESYQEALKHGQQPSYRARINIIGHSGAGKTTLTRRLLGEAFTEDIGSINGIETHRVEVDLTEGSTWSESILSSTALQREKLQQLARCVQPPTEEVPPSATDPAQNLKAMPQHQKQDDRMLSATVAAEPEPEAIGEGQMPPNVDNQSPNSTLAFHEAKSRPIDHTTTDVRHEQPKEETGNLTKEKVTREEREHEMVERKQEVQAKPEHSELQKLHEIQVARIEALQELRRAGEQSQKLRVSQQDRQKLQIAIEELQKFKAQLTELQKAQLSEEYKKQLLLVTEEPRRRLEAATQDLRKEIQSRNKKALLEEVQEQNRKFQTNTEELLKLRAETTERNRIKAEAKNLRNLQATDSADERNNGIIQLWDFGGQTEFYTTHHIFFDANAVNIIVMDISKSLTEPLQKNEKGQKAGVPNTQQDLLCYWLRTIQLKSNEKPQSILLVFTHKDQIPVEGTQQYTEQFLNSVQNIMEKNELRFLPEENIFLMDNTTNREEDFQNLRRAVFRNINTQQTKLISGETQFTWGAAVPVRWLKLEADVYQASSFGISQNLDQLAARYSMSAVELQAFYNYHHAMGNFLYFPQIGMRNYLMTDPQNMIDVFKKIIAPEKFAEEKSRMLLQGRVDFRTLQHLLVGQNVELLTAILQRVDLMLPVGSVQDPKQQQFIIPSMLPHKNVELRETDTTKLVYRARHLAKHDELIYVGAFSRLVVECSKSWPIRDNEDLSYGYASFDLGNGLVLAASLPHGSIVDISVWAEPGPLKSHPEKSLLEVTKLISSKLQNCRVPQSSRFKVLCPSWEPGEQLAELVTGELLAGPGADNFHYTDRFCPCHNTGNLQRKAQKCVDFLVKIYDA